MKNEVLLALADRLINDAILEHEKNHPSLRGPRGLAGKNAKDFCFDDYKDLINDLIIKNIPDVKDGKDFSFEEHSDRIIEIIKANIPQVKDGKDFIFEEHSLKIFDYIDSIKDSIKLKFSDLTDEEKNSLKGSKGNAGRAGRDFVFEEHKEEIYSKIEDTFNLIKDSLKLKFSDLSKENKEELKLKFDDLTQEDISILKGPRGQRGKSGRDFCFEENQERINEQISNYILTIKDQLKGDKGDNGKTIRGMPGVAGLNGKNGMPGKNGEDAPYIAEVRIESQKNGKFRFIFIFSDGSEIETNDVELPVTNNAVTQYVMLQGDTTSSDIVITDVPCDPTVYIGAAVRMLSDGSCVNALADSYGNANVIGICQTKASSILCNVRVMGVLPELYVGLDVTKEYYLSDTIPGGIADTFPDTTGHIKLKLGQPFTTKRLFVFKGERVVRG